MNRGKKNPAFIGLGVIIGAVVVGLGLFLALALIVQFSRPDRTPVGVVTAALTVVPLPSSTPTPTAVPEDLLPDVEHMPSPPPVF